MMWRTGGVNIEHKEATPVPGVINQHMNGEPDQDGLDIFNVSRLQQKFRKEMWNRVQEDASAVTTRCCSTCVRSAHAL